MTDNDKLRALARRQIAHFEALRKLGFPSDEIFVAFYNGGELFTTLRERGKEFNITISKGEKIDAQAYQPVYEEVATAWNTTMTKKEREEIYFGEFTEMKLAELALVLKMKGFDVNPARGMQQ